MRHVCVRFVAAKTRIAPLGGMMIPCLELLSAFLLFKLIVNVEVALQPKAKLGNPVCYTDSRVALYWIQGCNQEWKQFVENQVNSIRASVPPQCWGHCPGKENPANIPSRGMTASELLSNHLWLNGPDWLYTGQDLPVEGMDTDSEIPEECHQETKSKKAAHSLVVAQGHGLHIGRLIQCENFSSLHRLLRVTALVLKFLRLLRLKVRKSSESAPINRLSDIGSEMLNLSYSKTASFLCVNTSSTYLSTSLSCGGVVAECLTQIFPRQLKLRYFSTRITR